MITFLNTIAPWLDLVAPLLCLLFIIFRKEKRLGEHVFIVIYILLQLILNGWAKLYMHWKQLNAFIYQVNCTTSLVILSAYFVIKYRPDINRRAFYTLTTVSLAAIIITLTIALTENVNISIFNSRSYSIVAVMVSLYTIIYYYLKLVTPKEDKIVKTRSFWFNTGLFTYYSGCFFIFTTYRWFVQVNPIENYSILWSMHNVIFLLMCISFSIGFTCKNYQMT